jgi:hypothetical protein
VAALADLVQASDGYLLIEGRDTHPIDVEERRSAQARSKIRNRRHIAVQEMLEG